MTTTDLIGNGVLALLEYPDELRRLRDDPSLIKNAVEEMLRFNSPVEQTQRMLTSDVVMSGIARLSAGRRRSSSHWRGRIATRPLIRTRTASMSRGKRRPP